jgi:hypothetical protein
MQRTDSGGQLLAILEHNLDEEVLIWLNAKLNTILSGPSARDLFLTYALLGNKLQAGITAEYPEARNEIQQYLQSHEASGLEVARIYILCRVLEENKGYFTPKVAQLIQLADTGELRTFLRYLNLLPGAEAFSNVAVEALRTNIATIFDAIALDNPYPGKYFNEQQWNQMYLKAAFMQRDLGRIQDVDDRANKDLARIISDYAHERWAASRDVDPLFWRPVSKYIEGKLAGDIQRLLNSEDPRENRAAALCCMQSGKVEAKELLRGYPELLKEVKQGNFNWFNLKETSHA